MNKIEEMVESKEMRENLIERTDVLEKVKTLFLIPGIEMVTMKQIADYYEVDRAVIERTYQRNKAEITSDGVKVVKLHEVLTQTSCLSQRLRGGTEFTYDGGTFVISNAGATCFSARAVLRFGMLLRDSEVAKEVRTQLLNVYEHADEKQRTEDLDTELAGLQKISSAMASGDVMAIMTAWSEMYAFQTRHMQAVQKENKILAGEIAEWDNRSVLNRIIRCYAMKACNSSFPVAWKEFYQQMNYKYHINLKNRNSTNGETSVISRIANDEWSQAFKVAVMMCERRGIDPQEYIGESNFKKVSDYVSHAPSFLVS